MSKVIKVKSKDTGEVFHMKEHKFHPSFHELVVEKKEVPKKKASTTKKS